LVNPLVRNQTKQRRRNFIFTPCSELRPAAKTEHKALCFLLFISFLFDFLQHKKHTHFLSYHSKNLLEIRTSSFSSHLQVTVFVEEQSMQFCFSAAPFGLVLITMEKMTLLYSSNQKLKTKLSNFPVVHVSNSKTEEKNSLGLSLIRPASLLKEKNKETLPVPLNSW
jgi:hypothetical protein